MTENRAADGHSVRLWWEFADRIVRDHRDLLDATNVFPVAEGDTGTNLVHTLHAVASAVAERAGVNAEAILVTAARAAAMGARGNSGILISLFLAGVAEGWRSEATDGPLVAGLRAAASRMRAGLAQPADGTILSVAEAAADGARQSAQDGADSRECVRQVLIAARTALIAGPEQLPALAGAGVVDAGGLALVLVFEALSAALAGSSASLCAGATDCPHRADAAARRGGALRLRDTPPPGSPPPVSPPLVFPPAAASRYEVMFRVRGTGAPIEALFAALDRLGDSVSMVRADADLHIAHVHTDEPGSAVEAGMSAGPLTDIRIEVLPPVPVSPEPIAPDPPPRPVAPADTAGATSVVLAFVVGAGCARLFAAGGALAYRLDRRDGLNEVADLLDRRPADRVLVMPNGLLGTDRISRAVDLIRERGAAADLLWSATVVQGLAALSVRNPQRSAAEDLYAMSAAVAGTRWGTVMRSRTRVLTGIRLAEAGELLARLGVEVVEIGRDPVLVTCRLLDRFLDAGGEVVTVLSGLAAPPGIEEGLRRHIEDKHPGVELTVLDGGMPDDIVSVGVE